MPITKERTAGTRCLSTIALRFFMISSLIRRTIASIQQVVGSMYDEKQIEKTCKQIAAGVEVSSIADSDFIQQVFARLQSQKQKKSVRRKAPSHEDLLNAVLGTA